MPDRIGLNAREAKEARKVVALAGKLGHLMAGKGPTMQGAVLAEMTAMWLAGHVVLGDPVATDKLRLTLLTSQISAISALTKINAELIGTALLAATEGGNA